MKSRAQHTGRSYGGAPFRNGNGHGRGGRMNYSGERSERSNPFAAHLDPSFIPPFQNSGPGAPPGWAPPAPGSASYSRGPPPPPRGAGNYQYQPSNQFGPPAHQSYQGTYQHSGYQGQGSAHGYQHPSYGSYNQSSQYNPRDYYDNYSNGSGYQDRRGNNNDYRGGYNDHSRQGRGSHRGGHSNGYGRY